MSFRRCIIDDGGDSWQRGEIVGGTLVNPCETVAVAPPGRVMLNIRSESDALRRAVVYSKDGATGWTLPVFEQDLFEPVCMGSLLRYPKGRRPLLFANPDHLDDAAPFRKGRNSTRQNLTLQASWNDGKTWRKLLTVDPDLSAYSDLAVNARGESLILYEKGGRDKNAFFRTSLSLVRLDAKLLRPLRVSIDRTQETK